EPTVHEAAAAFAVDPEVLMGVGAAESAFYPRDSPDGGRGLFQITAPPAAAPRCRAARSAQPASQRLPRRGDATPLPRGDARRSLPRAARLQHRPTQRRAAHDHGAVRRTGLRDDPALSPEPPARLPDPRAHRGPRLPAVAHRGAAPALRGG